MSVHKQQLALHGGTPIVRDHASLIAPWPHVRGRDIKALIALMRRGEFSGRNSDVVKHFEARLCSYIGVGYANLFSTGTSALHGCVNALSIGLGDEVIVPAFTFLAPAMAVLHNGALPVFCDVDPDTFNIDPSKIEELISPRTRAIIAVHLQGLPADMPRILEIANRHSLPVIEDCAQSFGAHINGKHCGAMGDIAAHSFMSAKQLATCGELGAITTSSLMYCNKANILKTYGEILDGNKRLYNSYTMGYNYVPNPLQAEFATNKLSSFDEDIQPLIANAEKLSSFITKNIPFLKAPYVPEGYRHVYHFYRLKVRGESIGFENNGVLRQALMDIMEGEGLKLRLYQTRPVPSQTVFQTLNSYGKSFPWSCVERKQRDFYRENYADHNYPITKAIVSESVVVGGNGAAPLYFSSNRTIDKYIEGFEKIMGHVDDLKDYAHSLEKTYREPWEHESTISDTTGTFGLIKPDE